MPCKKNGGGAWGRGATVARLCTVSVPAHVDASWALAGGGPSRGPIVDRVTLKRARTRSPRRLVRHDREVGGGHVAGVGRGGVVTRAAERRSQVTDQEAGAGIQERSNGAACLRVRQPEPGVFALEVDVRATCRACPLGLGLV